jgi:hypothetical protein
MTRRPLFSAALAWLAGILILASGCMDQSPTATVLETATVSPAAVLPAGVSAVRAAAPYEAGSVSQTITPAGGSIDFGIGTIVFPKNAVQRATVITATVDGVSMAVEFGPHGLTFPADAQPQLMFGYKGIDITNGASIYYIDDQGAVLEDLGGVIDSSSETVSAWLQHFSPYILGAS